MAHQAKTLLVATIDKKVNNFLRTIINNIIGGEVKVYGLTLGKDAPGTMAPDVVMASGRFLLPKLRSIFPNRVIIAPKRLITGYNLEKVLMLKRGARVLVVNHPRFASEDTIESLKSLGITHIEYVPYWKGMKKEIGDIDTAISPGMAHLCPGNIRRVIDIGPRIISIYSFLQLLIALDLDLSYLENYATYHHNFLMESSRKLSEVLEQSELLRSYQEVILNQFEDGLLSVNESGKIDIANRAAAVLFGKKRENLLSANISDILSNFKHRANLSAYPEKNLRHSAIYDYDGKQIVSQKIPVSSKNAVRHIYTFREIAKIQRLEKNVRLHLAHKGYVTKYGFEDIWTKSRIIDDLKERASNFAITERNILITGESGTGKELFAHAIHRSSPRRDGPFVAINFAGIPESLIESELFGYEPGAFTGAQKGGKPGLFEQAHGGTIFLDEIGDAPANVQSRLLRVLQEREVMKVGADRIIPIDVRIVAGTNKDLHEAMRKKRFRNDLYYRLSTLPLEIPPLREHKEDILFILKKWLAERCGIEKEFAAPAVECLTRYSWPGNTRELINLAEYISISAMHKDSINLGDLPKHFSVEYPRSGQTEVSGSLWREGNSDLGRTAAQQFQEMAIDPVSGTALLKILQARPGLPVGRLSLIGELARVNCHITEATMKRYLRTLRDKGFVHVGTTKQGTCLAPRGEKFFQSLLASDAVY
jgi:sigma-54 dependent transcriptional regulator, acetoin dehydrogenase operon transcriptional activator AcoR